MGDIVMALLSSVLDAAPAVVLAALFASIGYWLLYSLFFSLDTTKVTNSISGISSYLLTGLAMFAPYAANQFRTIFKS